ncbi:hypothetical protein AAEH84_00015 [Shewanella indica]|uniref:hypothetical protein n=1 Tax=Shewanella indica TaxID=768528 RepID=UPI00313B2141
MTICAAWIRKSGNSEELVFVTDSRLRSFGSWDCNPKIYTFARSDFVMCFSGDTIFSYPMMIQLKNEVELNPKIKNRYQRLSVFKGVVLNILNGMLEHKSDYEIPDVEFIFGGYCWHTQQFKLWKLVYQKDIKKFTHRPISFWRGVKGTIKVAFSGDYLDEAKHRLVDLLKERGIFESGSLDMEPLEVIRDMLLSPNADRDFHLIGGAPQMVKVYKSLNRVPFGVKWEIEGKEVVTLFGKPVKSFRNMPLPVVDPHTLEYSNTNAYG